MKLLLAAALAALQLSDAEPLVTAASLLAEPHPETYDYYALRSRLGPPGLSDLQRQGWKVLETQNAGSAGSSCPSASQAAVLAGLTLAALAPSAEAFSADRVEGLALRDEIAAEWTRLRAGGEPKPEHKGAAMWLQRAREAADPRLAELYGRVARDQFVRTADPRAMRNGPAGVGDRPALYASQLRMAEFCSVDADNTSWLKAQLKDHGWFKLSRYGQEADSAAFLIVQHADRDRAFQREMLPVLETLAAEKETQARSFAYLYDRLASAEKRPQRHGTQGRCRPGGQWEPDTVEDPARVDERRATVGLEPLAEYQARFRDRCPA